MEKKKYRTDSIDINLFHIQTSSLCHFCIILLDKQVNIYLESYKVQTPIFVFRFIASYRFITRYPIYTLVSFYELRCLSKLTYRSIELHAHVYIEFPNILSCTVSQLRANCEIM